MATAELRFDWGEVEQAWELQRDGQRFFYGGAAWHPLQTRDIWATGTTTAATFGNVGGTITFDILMADDPDSPPIEGQDVFTQVRADLHELDERCKRLARGDRSQAWRKNVMTFVDEATGIPDGIAAQQNRTARMLRVLETRVLDLLFQDNM